MRVYVASSWRNPHQPAVVELLRRYNHQVYDFRNPSPGDTGFSWASIDPDWEKWTPQQYREALDHPLAVAGHLADYRAMQWCDACLLVLPAGRSASWELGWCMGAGKQPFIFVPSKTEPELMFRGARMLTTWDELGNAFLWERAP